MDLGPFFALLCSLRLFCKSKPRGSISRKSVKQKQCSEQSFALAHLQQTASVCVSFQARIAASRKHAAALRERRVSCSQEHCKLRALSLYYWFLSCAHTNWQHSVQSRNRRRCVRSHKSSCKQACLNGCMETVKTRLACTLALPYPLLPCAKSHWPYC